MNYVLGVVLDLADVPSSDGWQPGDTDEQRPSDGLSYSARQQELVVAGLEDVHGRTMPSTPDSDGTRLPLPEGVRRR